MASTSQQVTSQQGLLLRVNQSYVKLNVATIDGKIRIVVCPIFHAKSLQNTSFYIDGRQTAPFDSKEKAFQAIRNIQTGYTNGLILFKIEKGKLVARRAPEVSFQTKLFRIYIFLIEKNQKKQISAYFQDRKDPNPKNTQIKHIFLGGVRIAEKDPEQIFQQLKAIPPQHADSIKLRPLYSCMEINFNYSSGVPSETR